MTYAIYNNYAFVVSEAYNHGLQVFNLNRILDRVSEMKMEEKSIDEIKEEIESILKRLNIKITSNTSVFIDILT